MFRASLVAIATAICLLQQAISLPAGWKVVRPPRYMSSEWACLNQRLIPYRVSTDSSRSRLIIEVTTEEELHADSLYLSDGKLVSHDFGEFGGNVTWQPTLGTPTRILTGNPVRLELRNDTVLVFDGMAHLSYNYGYLLALTRRHGPWRVDTLGSLGYAPAAVMRSSPSTYLVAAADAMLLVAASGHATVLRANQSWGGLYPTSIVRDRAGTVYVGARGAVFRVSDIQRSATEDWLAPDSSPCLK
jgi:hypothetical protein